jgi:putative FmdB family regulatory protein
MPTYEYVCKSCGDTIEVFQSFSDKPLRRHEACGGDLQKVFHARGVVFKGSGFYSTDARAAKSSSEPASKAKKKESTDSSSDKTPASSTTSTSDD